MVLTGTRIDHKKLKQYVSLTRSNYSDAELTQLEQQGRESIINLFKKGTILNFFDSYKYIKNEIFKDAEFMRLFHLHDWSNDKMTVKVCDLLVSLKNPLLITIVFKCLFWIKYHR